MPKKTEAKRIASMDFARFACALYIAGFWHIREYLDDASKAAFGKAMRTNVAYQTTYCILALFTLLSGYFARVGRGGGSLGRNVGRFYVKKIIRLYPLFALAAVGMWQIGRITAQQLGHGLSGLGMFNATVPSLLTLWYVCMLLMFYLVTPLVGCMDSPWKKAAVVLAIEGLLAVMVHTLALDERAMYYWPFFGSGLLLQDAGDVREALKKLSHPVCVVICMALALWVEHFLGKDLCAETWIAAPLFAMSVLGLGELLTRLPVLAAWAIRCGYACFCVYLFHRIGLELMFRAFGPLPMALAECVCIPVCLVAAYLIQWLYDRLVSGLGRAIHPVAHQ